MQSAPGTSYFRTVVGGSLSHLIYGKELFALHWPQGSGGRKPGYLPKVFVLGKSLSGVGVRGGGLEHNQVSETPSQDAKEVATSRRLGPESGILSPMDSSPLRGHRAEVMLCPQVCDALGVLNA